MTAIKITKFLGTAPRNSPELLADTAAQAARNTKLYSGDLIPYPQPVIVANTKRTGTISTIYGLRRHGGSDIKWLSFANKVDIVTPATDELEEHRFYYTGDGKPKVSTYDLAVGTSSGPYPIAYYDLGLPLPTTKPTVTPTPYRSVTALTFARDAANLVTLTTVDNHNLKSGAIITVSGFAYRTGTYSRTGTTITVSIPNHGLSSGAQIYLEFTSGGGTTNIYTITVTGTGSFTCSDTASGSTSGNARMDIRDFNTIAEIAVIDDTTISYYAPGPQIAETTVVQYGTYTQSGSATATITSTAHGLTSGDIVYLTVTSGTATTGAYPATVTDANTFTVVMPNSATTSGDVDINIVVGKIDLGDQLQGRSYLYTWFTPWREESIGSDPTEPAFIREGQIVTISNLPSVKPSGNNNIGGIRLYRTLATPTASDFFLLKTLWFPATVLEMGRTNGTTYVKMAQYHNLIKDDRVKIVCTSNPSFDVTDGVVTRIISATEFEIAQPGADITTGVVSATLYYDVSEKSDYDARYWGDAGNFSFTDDFNYRSLLDILSSTEYEPPPEGLQGLTVMQNNILAGFVGNDLYFSEPGKYHAWPSQYRRSFEYDIVALAYVGGMLLVLTDGFPYIVEGSTPATLSPQKLAVMYPCLSAASVTQTSFGVIWATHDGLAAFNTGGAQLLTKIVHHSDTWRQAVDPSEMVGAIFKENFIGSTSTAALTLESLETNDGTGLSFVDLDFTFSATWFDPQENVLYAVNGTNGDIYQWDDLTQNTMTARWKSKVFITPMPVNLGAAKVVADYDGESESPLWEVDADTWNTSNTMWNGGVSVTFNLYVNKSLIFTTERTDSGVFRLPAGYKSDTFEIEVLSPVRVRSIHVADTPLGLQTV